MKACDMIQGVRYVVVRPSKHREFQTGDSITLYADGCIGSHTAHGWMDVADVPAATRGMTVSIDTAWIAKRRGKLEAELVKLAGASRT